MPLMAPSTVLAAGPALRGAFHPGDAWSTNGGVYGGGADSPTPSSAPLAMASAATFFFSEHEDRGTGPSGLNGGSMLAAEISRLAPGAFATAAGAALAARAVARGRHSRAPGGKYHGGRCFAVSAVARRAGNDDVLAEAKAAAEAAKLELEAAQIRAEIEEMERKTAMDRRATRAERLLSGSVGVGAAELVSRLKESEDIEITEAQAEQLAKACGQDLQGDTPAFFKASDLASKKFDDELIAFVQAARAEKERAVMEERRLEAERRQKQAEMPLIDQDELETRDDAGLRLFGIMVYILPLIDCLRLGVPAVTMFPDLSFVLLPFVFMNVIINAIPFGSVILLVLLIIGAQQRNVFARKLRYNMEQAVLIDLALFFPSAIITGLQVSGNEAFTPWASLFFLALVYGTVAYCCLAVSKGEDPDKIPLISNLTKNVVDQGTF